MRNITLFITALFITPSIFAQPTTANCCSDKLYKNKELFEKMRMQENGIVEAVAKSAKKCDFYRLFEVKDIKDVYSVLSIQANSKSSDVICEAKPPCTLLSPAETKDLRKFVESKDYDDYVSFYYQRTHQMNKKESPFINEHYVPNTEINPMLFPADFRKLLKEIKPE